MKPTRLLIAVLLALVGVVSGCNGADTASSMPAIGDSVTLSSMTAATIPAGKLIEELQFDPSGKQTLRLVIDPRGRRGFREMVTWTNVPSPGFGFMVFDDGGHSEMGETNLEVTPYGGAGFAQIVGIYDNLSGKEATVTGHETVGGRQAYVATTTLSLGEGGGTVEAVATVDPETNLIVREEYRAAGATEQSERRVIDATSELVARMDIENMDSIVEGYRQTRKAGLKTAPLPVYGLPSGYMDLPLSWIIPSPDGRRVTLQYGEAPGDYIQVTTLDPKEYPEYGAELLAPLDQAWIDPEGAGDVTEMRFGIGDVGVEIQTRKDIIRQVAEDLIVVGGPGS